MGEGIISVGVKLNKNGAPIGEETRGSSNRRGDVVKSVSKTARGYNVTGEEEAGCVSRGV
jgi:hypothetical protein